MGKWHLGDELFPQHGFDEWVSIEPGYNEHFREGRPRDARTDYDQYLLEQGYEPDLETPYGRIFSRDFAAELPEEHSKPAFLADRATEFIRRHRDEPFILSVNFLEPHTPYTSPRDDQYDHSQVDLPPNFEHEGLERHSTRIREDREAVATGENHPRAVEMSTPPTRREWREYISNYWGLVSLVDTHAGRILNALSACDVAGDTAVAFTSDHGDQLASHQLWAKNYMFEESAHVPLLLRLPGEDREPGRRIEAPFSHLDLVPTLLEAIDQPVPDAPSGRSWHPALTGERSVPQEPVLMQFDHTSAQPEALEGASAATIREATAGYVRAVVTPAGWKYVFRAGDSDAVAADAIEESLYDLEGDPYETTSLTGDPAHDGTLTDLRETLLTLQETYGDPLGERTAALLETV